MNEFEIRGHLAAELTCWHRLSGPESSELVAMVQRMETNLAAELDLVEKDKQIGAVTHFLRQYTDKCAALTDELAAAQKDAARYRKLRYMEASMVAPDTIAHYIRNVQRLDYTIGLDAECKEYKK